MIQPARARARGSAGFVGRSHCAHRRQAMRTAPLAAWPGGGAHAALRGSAEAPLALFSLVVVVVVVVVLARDRHRCWKAGHA